MSTNYLAQFSANLSTFNAVNINYSTLTGSTIIVSTVVNSTIVTRQLNFSTMVGSTITASMITASTMTASTITASGPIISNNFAALWMPSNGAASIYITDSSSNLFAGTTTYGRYFGTGGTIYQDFYGTFQWRGTAVNGTVTSENIMSLTSAGNLSVTGNVGIGITNPSTLLHISGSSNGNASLGQLFISDANNTAQQGRFYSYWSGVASSSYFAIQSINTTAPTYNQLILNPNGGNVGIGITTPGYALDIRRSLQLTANPMVDQLSDNIFFNVKADDSTNGDGGTTVYSNSINLRAGDLIWTGNRVYGAQIYIGGGYSVNAAINPGVLTFSTGNAVRMTIAGNGNVGIGTTGSGILNIYKNSGNLLLCSSSSSGIFYISASETQGAFWNGSNTVVYVAKDTVTNRSINAGGTINASGADYAEYMVKNGTFTINKGDIVGVDSNGLLTNQYDNSITFMVKSTNPSYVGGDVWGTEEIVGKRPELPENPTDADKSAYDLAFAAWKAAMEVERQKVDRIAYSGQVPVNVQGSHPGDYIIPICNSDGSIGGQAVSSASVTFQQYQSAVGKVLNILADGRPNVKVL